MYFNLIIRADESSAMPSSRMFENTDPEIQRLFERNGKPDLRALRDLPTIMVQEFGPDTGKQIARIGYIDSPSMCPTMKNPIFCFPSDLLIERQILGDETYTPNRLKWVGHHTRWTVFEGDPFRTLFAGDQLEPENLDCSRAIDETMVAVMMPFNRGHHSIDPVFKAIEEGVKGAGKTASRVDQRTAPANIPDDIRHLIRSSCAVIVDLTGLNSNVLYELGFADGAGKKPILIQKGPIDKLPFDVSTRRVIAYQEDKDGLDALSKTLTREIRDF